MRIKSCSVLIVFLLGFLLSMVARQFIGDHYYRMAHGDGSELDDAIEYLERCIAIENNNALFHFSLGRAFLGKGLADPRELRERNKWLRKSIVESRRAIELEPSNSGYHFFLGMSYACLTYPPSLYWNVIENSFNRTAVLNPTDIRNLNSMAVYYLDEYVRLKDGGAHTASSSENYVIMAKENYQLYFRKLLDVDETYVRKVLEKTFSVTQLYTDLRGVMRDTAEHHAFFARFLDGKGMWEEAEKEYGVAIGLEPGNPIHYWNLAQALFRRRYYEDAIYWWGKQKVLDPGDAKPYLSSARGFMKLKRFDDALLELRDVITLYPDNISYRIELARTLLVAGRLAEAIDEYRTIMGIDPRFSKTTYDTIRQHQRRGNYHEATRILNEVLSSARSS